MNTPPPFLFLLEKKKKRTQKEDIGMLTKQGDRLHASMHA